jgi:hypothetical protein
MPAPPLRPTLALRGIALFEVAKGLLALGAAAGIISFRHSDLHVAADTFLLRHGFDPERHFTRLFIEALAKATHHGVGEIAALASAYAGFAGFDLHLEGDGAVAAAFGLGAGWVAGTAGAAGHRQQGEGKAEGERGVHGGT